MTSKNIGFIRVGGVGGCFGEKLWQYMTVALLLAGCANEKGGFRAQRPSPYSAYTGEYRMETNVTMIVRTNREKLMAKVTGQDYFEMVPSGSDLFAFKVVEAQVAFIRSGSAGVSGLVLSQGGKDFRFQRISRTVPNDFSRQIDAGGYRVRMAIKGRGNPTVVLEAGLGESLDAWEKVLLGVAVFSRVVAYDRSGLGLSERSGTPRTAENIARDLHCALRNAGLRPPFVLVGNSAGGLYSRVFAHRYPTEVDGMVLVEPSSEDYEAWLHEKHPDAFEGAEEELAKSTEGFRDHVAAWDDSLKEARTAWPLPRVPVLVLTGMRHEAAEAEKRQMWLAMHRGLVERIPGARHQISPRSGHGLASNEPEMVIAAVREVIEKARR